MQTQASIFSVRTAILLVLMLLVVGQAWASIHEPVVIIQADMPDRNLQPGESFEIPVRIAIRTDAVVGSIVAVTDDQTVSLEFSERYVLPDPDVEAMGYQIQEWVLSGTLSKALDQVEIEVEADREVWRNAIKLRSSGDLTVPESTIDPSITTRFAEADNYRKPDPVPSGHSLPEPNAAKAARNVRVHGRVIMRVSDTTPWVGADGATVYFMQRRDILDDIELGLGVTNANGDFDFDASMDGTHDVYIKIRALNSHVNVGTDAGFQTYGRNTAESRNFSNTDFNAGSQGFFDDMNVALWLLSTLTRSHRWYAAHGYAVPPVNCRYPDDIILSSVYLQIPTMEGIHLRTNARWNSHTVVHEYAHHFVGTSEIQEVAPPFYTNGVCDPGHCEWCHENEAVAWSEGLPSFLSETINNEHRAAYGWTQPSNRSYEGHDDCRETEAIATDPTITEAFVSALMHDIVDNSPDSSTLAPGVTETARFPIDDILYVAANYRGDNSLRFVDDFMTYIVGRADYGAQDYQDYWSAAAINGFASDTVPPTAPTVVTSTTHVVGVTSASNLPEFAFSGATDDNSGVAQYIVNIAAAPGYPTVDTVVVERPEIAWETVLPEGTYFANVASIDRAGNASTDYSYFGPLVVGPATPLDFVPVTDYGWDAPLVLRHSDDANGILVPNEAVLLANTDVWINFFARNVSPSAGVVDAFGGGIVIDRYGLGIADFFGSGTVASGEDLQILNLGPVQFAGGRHHARATMDYSGAVAESDENNNTYNIQFVVQPEILVPGGWQIMPAGPAARSGRGDYTPEFHNMAGVRIVPQNTFAAVELKDSSFYDYTLRMFRPSTGADNGFDYPLISSQRGAAEIESIIVNTNTVAESQLDFGCEAISGYDRDIYWLRHTSSRVINPGDSDVVNLANDEYLSLWEMTFNVLEVGPFAADIEVVFDPADTNRSVAFNWVHKDVIGHWPSPFQNYSPTDADGRASLEFAVESPGTYCLYIRRDIRPWQTAYPIQVNLTTSTVPLPDFTIFRDNAGWSMPFLPSIEPLPGPDVPVPSDLLEGLSETYLNVAVRNLAHTSAANVPFEFEMDGSGQGFFSTEIQQLDALAVHTIYGTTPFIVGGGRHTLTMTIDPFDEIEERDESNNVLATQFGWSGPDLALGSSSMHAAPPYALAGLEDVEIFTIESEMTGDNPTAIPLNAIAPNADGFRLPNLPAKQAGRWVGVATMPGANSNVDVRLHEVMPPAFAFTTALATSDLAMGLSDFILVNFNDAPSRDFDIGVVNLGGSEPYTLHNMVSEDWGAPVDGSLYEQGYLSGGDILSLNEFYLGAGSYQITMTSGQAADLGISVYAPTPALGEPFHSKSATFGEVPSASQNPAGVDEVVAFEVPYDQAGNYCVAVWKAGTADLAQGVGFGLEFEVVAAAPPYIVTNGSADNPYGAPVVAQTIGTGFGDADLGLADEANGSELDAAYAELHDGMLYLLLAGNLESNFNDLEIFIDSMPGGQNVLRGDNFVFSDNGLNRMGDDGTGNGLTFDPSFYADYWFSVQGGFGELGPGPRIPYKFVVHSADLPTQGGGTGHFLGANTALAGGTLAGAGADNPFGVRVALDNRNVGGVEAGTGADNGANAFQGVEFAIPLAAIGNPTGCVRICAFVNGRLHDYVSNQVLGALPVGTDNLGEPRDVDFGDYAGNQYFSVCPAGVSAIEDEVPGVSVTGLTLYPARPNPFNPRTEIAFVLVKTGRVEISLYDLAGRRVRRLVDGEVLSAGPHERSWDGLDERGRKVASGTYLVRLKSGNEQRVMSVTLLK